MVDGRTQPTLARGSGATPRRTRYAVRRGQSPRPRPPRTGPTVRFYVCGVVVSEDAVTAVSPAWVNVYCSGRGSEVKNSG